MVEFPLQDPVRGQLEQEADRQRVSMDELLHHAALVYLADLDAAPAGDRMREELFEARRNATDNVLTGHEDARGPI